MKANKILIVDDQKFALQMLRDTLAPLHYVIEEATNGASAVSKAQEFMPDIILMDLVMPEMDGVEACRRIKQDMRTTTIPVIVITASKEKDNLLAAFAAGIDDYITKPFSDKELLARIRANLFKREAIAMMELKNKDAETVLDISQTITSTLDTREILQIIVKKIADHIEVKRCSIVKFSEEGYGFVLASSDNPSAKGIRIELSRYPELLEVIRSRKALVIRDAKHHPLLDDVKKYISDIDLDTILVVPILSQNEIIGSLMVRTTNDRNSFSGRELRFCQLVADASANAIKNASQFKKVLEESDELREIKEKLEKELAEKAVYESLFEHASEGLMVLNARGEPVYVNRSALDILGYQRDQMLKMTLTDFLAEESFQVGMENHMNFFLGRNFRNKYDLLFKTKCGEKRCVAVSVSNYRLEGNYAILTFMDVTEERRAQHQLAEANERLKGVNHLKSEFIYTATNDLRLPVAVIHSNCSQLRDSDTNNLTEMQREHLDSAIDSCDRLMDLIEELLDNSNFDSSELELSCEDKNIMESIQEVYTVLAPFAWQNGLQMSVEPLQDNISAFFDSKKIQCVLTNLIGNAIKFTPSGGKIGISVAVSDEELLVSVTDTGEGIPENYITKIFNEFYHLKSTNSSAKKGSGLGLAICKRIVDAHSGRMWVDSTLNHGSTFSFALPLSRS